MENHLKNKVQLLAINSLANKLTEENPLPTRIRSKESDKRCMARYYQKNKEAWLKKSSKYYQENREKINKQAVERRRKKKLSESV